MCEEKKHFFLVAAVEVLSVTIFAQSPCRLREEKGYYIVVGLMYDVHLKC